MNWKAYGRKRSWFITKHYVRISREEMKTTQELNPLKPKLL
jgi:hypothetical protein